MHLRFPDAPKSGQRIKVRRHAPGPLAVLAVVTLLAVPPGAAARDIDVPPLALPGEAAAVGVSADPANWLVGARPGAEARRIAHRFGARAIGSRAIGAFRVRRAGARAFAAALRARGLLVSAEPNAYRGPAQAPAADPLTPLATWRNQVVSPATAVPAVTAESPLLGLVDSQLDASHPEFAGGAVTTVGTRPVTDEHGTATAAVAAAPVNGVGISGVWPGMRAVNASLPQPIRCSDSVEQIGKVVGLGAAVINMSYGSDSLCFQEYVQIQFAVAGGVIPVAAAGNEFGAGNPLEFPASLPHVLTVTSVRGDNSPSFFSNANAAIDLAAPGEGVLTAVPPAFDSDGVADGWQALGGTSFSAPIVAAAVAWVRAARPTLSPSQVAQVVRLSAGDVAPAGWDPGTGFGVLNIDQALIREPPPTDPLEPNDDMFWVDGRAFDRPDRAVFGGRRRVAFAALLDRFEDPNDVYRIVLPARRRVRIAVRPVFGDPDVALFDRGARSVSDNRRRLRRSRRPGSRTDVITYRNRGRRARAAFVRVYIGRDARTLDAGYVITISRR